jgi:ABC-type Fe3+/spermidine/putrescine transport system ATPase subunit
VDVAGTTLRVAAGRTLAAGEAVELAIRPERVGIDTLVDAGGGENVVTGRVVRLGYLGAQMEVTVEIAEGTRVVSYLGEPLATSLAVGQAVRMTLPADAFMVL